MLDRGPHRLDRVLGRVDRGNGRRIRVPVAAPQRRTRSGPRHRPRAGGRMRIGRTQDPVADHHDCGAVGAGDEQRILVRSWNRPRSVTPATIPRSISAWSRSSSPGRPTRTPHASQNRSASVSRAPHEGQCMRLLIRASSVAPGWRGRRAGCARPSFPRTGPRAVGGFEPVAHPGFRQRPSEHFGGAPGGIVETPRTASKAASNRSAVRRTRRSPPSRSRRSSGGVENILDLHRRL